MPCTDYPLCKRGYYEGKAVPIIICGVDGSPCAFQRYCTDLKRNIHASAYVNCREVSRLTEIKETKRQKSKHKIAESGIDKFEICPAMYVGDTMYINFLGFGITYDNKENIKTSTVKVLYHSEIGKPDFEFTVLENEN